MFEINPLVLTKEQQMIALDAKVNFDDNALFRHPEYAELRDLDEEDPLEIEASKSNLSLSAAKLFVRSPSSVSNCRPSSEADRLQP